ncbi:MAG: hypothetical protein QOI47_1778, partial [Actinomycetota bacterium]|nr:hypothetical protein [Actinomycetota bacterium]
MSFDDAVERLSRRSAARSTRRTFLSRVGKAAVLVAGGPVLASLLVERAEARVCGQSGTSQKCPTFDCDGPGSVWGWCWYASAGCCAGGGLKKICDCCTADFPNVHGYCPAGHNVRCMVESCFADPRVVANPVERALGMTASAVALARSRRRTHSPTVVIGDADDARLAAVAGPIATFLGAPLLLTGRSRLASAVLAEVQRLGATHAVAVGGVPQAHLSELEAYGLTTEHTGLTSSARGEADAAATWMLGRTHGRSVMCIETDGVSADSAAAAAAVAGQLHMPLVIGVDSAVALDLPVVWLVGPEAAARAGEVSGGFPIRGASKAEVAGALATAVLAAGAAGAQVHLAPSS